MKKKLLTIGIILFVGLGIMQIQNTQKINMLEDKLYNSSITSNKNNYIEYNSGRSYTNDNLYVIASNNMIKQEITSSKTVYLTNTGSKYHKSGCRYLKTSSTPVTLEQAISMGKTSCSVCKP